MINRKCIIVKKDKQKEKHCIIVKNDQQKMCIIVKKDKQKIKNAKKTLIVKMINRKKLKKSTVLL